MPSAPPPATRTLVVGESVADVVQPLQGAATTHPGGSPANVAYGLARLGHPVTLLTELGHDPHGALLREHLASAGVDVLVQPSSTPRRTPTATARLGADGAATYEFAINWTLDATPLPPGTRHVHAGSIAAYLAPGADAVAELLTTARADATVSFDPNIRPGLLVDHADAVVRTARLVAAADVIKASDEDLAWLYPGEDPLAVARRWSGAGAGLVVVTHGADGAVAVAGGRTLRVAPVAVRVADTVGAGDAFMAALLHGLHMRDVLGPGPARDRLHAAGADALGDVLATAARAAAVTVSRAGANPPTLAELEA
ncbi:carbohydrate kinase family protein [Cellulomonas hominis]|uniref:carbohydrate kinase family protein n=1 Tax=Cellulomonas hominis TaxID=156981 RepID=UPI001B9D34C6|nr:carbohydrate kinase [Cellulomonas hominis]VTR75792.1 Fructokinase [Cellulomonas hominis]